MDVVLPRKDLLRLIDNCIGFANRKGIAPEHCNVRIVTNGNWVAMTTTDGRHAVTSRTVADVIQKNECTVIVHANQLAWGISTLPDGPIQIESQFHEGESSAIVRAIGYSRKLIFDTGAPAEFTAPPSPSIETAIASFGLPFAEFTSLIDRTVYAISRDTSRKHVNSLFLQMEKEKMTAVATDGHRMAVASMPAPFRDEELCHDLLIPEHAIVELQRLLHLVKGRGGEVTVRVVVWETHASFHIGGTELHVELTDVSFVPYKQLVQASYPRSVRVPKAELLDALRSVSVSASHGKLNLLPWTSARKTWPWKKTTGRNAMTFHVHRGVLTVWARGTRSSDELAIEYDGPDYHFGVECKYMYEALTACEEDEVRIEWNEAREGLLPIRIRSATNDRSFSITMTMPP